MVSLDYWERTVKSVLGVSPPGELVNSLALLQDGQSISSATTADSLIGAMISVGDWADRTDLPQKGWLNSLLHPYFKYNRPSLEEYRETASFVYGPQYDYENVRSSAIRVIGFKLISEESTSPLLESLERDPSPQVQATASAALSNYACVFESQYRRIAKHLLRAAELSLFTHAEEPELMEALVDAVATATFRTPGYLTMDEVEKICRRPDSGLVEFLQSMKASLNSK